MKDSVWVICISYDYGVWSEAGWFSSESDANKWIEAEHDRRRRQHKEFGDEDDYDEYKTQFYAVELRPGSN